MHTLAEKLLAKLGARDVACFVPEYMAAAYGQTVEWPVNELSSLSKDDLLLLDGRVKAPTFNAPTTGPSEVCVDGAGNLLYARITAADAEKLPRADIEAFVAAAIERLPKVDRHLATWNYTWDLILANPDEIASDFAAAGRHGVEGTIEQPHALRGSEKDLYVGRGAVIHPMVVIDAEHGPVYIDEDVEIHPFTRVEGPCYIGRESILLGAKCREGNSIGPMCRIGGEVEESIIHGHSNKYHDGFLGHAYVGQWVNLGALTTNSDLKNDYSSVSVMLDGKHAIDTGSTKVGSLIGDHAKTSIGALFNTGSYVGAMTVIMATGKPLPKFIPSFAWFVEGVVTKGFGRKKLYQTAETAMGRRGCEWSPDERAMWEAVFETTAPIRNEAVKRGRRAMMK
jgi:UDP-N-acetylglucosamine diphosphorylase/glucosamine-1-phosphate N-acetyltransferase